jgi:hypothetical protein
VRGASKAGVVGIDESMDTPYLNRAFIQANWLLAQWARKRFLCYQIQDYYFVSTGAQSYSVGQGLSININPRPDRLEYAFVRFLNGTPSGGLAVDVPLSIIPSRENYAQIAVKAVGTLPRSVFYDPGWPVGTLYPWPVPQATIYEIHCGFKVVLPRFANLQQKINFPPEYEAALNWCLARRLRVSYQMPADLTIDSLARDALNTIRLGNQAMGTLSLPRALRNRGPSCDYRGDTG